jgi:cytosine/adenosine deaminase-related metal-dependent hydrolase
MCRQIAPVSLVNADTGDGVRATLRIHEGRIVGRNTPPECDDIVIDLRGDRLLPGLINAHDHLQLNSFPRLSYPTHYRNAHEWSRDVDARRHEAGAFRASVAVPRGLRFLAGGLKNILSGVTTVAHHDPLDALALQDGFPTHLLAEFGWSHSLYLDGVEKVCASCARTPPGQPWIIHAAEGVDTESRAEFDHLLRLGCLRSNTLLVHGLALDRTQRQQLAAAGAGLIWCPSSNLRLFGRTAEVGELVARGLVALGSDSRLTAAGDLLDELRIARECSALDDAALERIVTLDSARLLRLRGRGTLALGAVADLLVLPAGMPLSCASRKDVRLVIRAGIGRCADHDYARTLGSAADWVEVRVDGAAKLLQRDLAQLLASGQVTEPGVVLAAALRRAS